MLVKMFGYVALGCVGLSALVGLVSVWFDNLIPNTYVHKSLTTLGILFASAVIAAIVSYFLL